MVSNVEVLTHLKGLIQFQEQSPNEVFTADELNVLHRKISTFEYLIDKAQKAIIARLLFGEIITVCICEYNNKFHFHYF